MVAVAFITWENDSPSEHEIYTFDLSSETRLGPSFVPRGKLVTPIWTHDEYLRFAIIYPWVITIWEVDFALKHRPTRVEYFSIPYEADQGREFLFLPSLHRLAFTLEDTIQVWDVKASKLLLKPKQVSDSHPKYSFSSNGRFFAFATEAGEVQIWEESPAGYAPHQQPPPFLHENLGPPFLSPNGRSIIFPFGDTINLWHTVDQTLSPPSHPTKEDDSKSHFLLAFSPNEKSAAFTRFSGNMVTILDLRSGDLWSTINTSMQVQCLGVTGGTVIVVDGKEVATWNLHDKGGSFKASIYDSIYDKVHTATLDHSSLQEHFSTISSLSPDLSCTMVLRQTFSGENSISIHSVTTGTCLASTGSGEYFQPWLTFTQDGQEVWDMDPYSGNNGWEIIKSGVSGAMELKSLEGTLHPSRTFLCHSIHGYKVTDDGWVLSPTQKRLLWLPHRWRSGQEYRLWSGRFLGLTRSLLLEPVILEFFE